MLSPRHHVVVRIQIEQAWIHLVFSVTGETIFRDDRQDVPFVGNLRVGIFTYGFLMARNVPRLTCNNRA